MRLRQRCETLGRDCILFGIGSDRQALQGFGKTLRYPVTDEAVKVVSVVEDSWTVIKWSKSRFAIAFEVEEAQRQEAASKKGKTSAMFGRTVESPSQHFSTSIQTSSERPRISRFTGREGRWPAKTSPGTRREAMRENGYLCAKT